MSSHSTQLKATAGEEGIVLIPVKAFEQAKGRLSATLAGSTRSSLAREMATHLVQAQTDVHVAVCCDDPGVADWASSLDASVIWCPGTDLNGAVQFGFETARRAGYASIAVAHSDLPLAGSLRGLLGWPGVTLVPDRHRTGSNVISVAATVDFEFSYGTNSFQRHVAEAVRHRCGLRIVHDAQLGWDVDHPDDLDVPEASFLTNLLDQSSL